MGEFTHARQMVTVHSVLALAMMSYLLQAVQAPYFGLNKAKMQSLIYTGTSTSTTYAAFTLSTSLNWSGTNPNK